MHNGPNRHSIKAIGTGPNMHNGPNRPRVKGDRH